MEESRLGFVPSYHGHRVQTNFVYITWRNNLLGKIEGRTWRIKLKLVSIVSKPVYLQTNRKILDTVS